LQISNYWKNVQLHYIAENARKFPTFQP
jgi:hypothetical protein